MRCDARTEQENIEVSMQLLLYALSYRCNERGLGDAVLCRVSRCREIRVKRFSFYFESVRSYT